MFDYKTAIKKLIASFENIISFFYALEYECVKAFENRPIEDYKYQHEFIGKNSTLTIVLSNQKCVELYLETSDRIIVLSRYGYSFNEFMQNILAFEEAMEEYELGFAPPFTDDFKENLLEIDKGSILALNNSKCYVCTNVKNGSIILKECFKGNVENISIESFKQSETFEVDLSDDNSIQELYKYAYNHRTKDADIRIIYNSKHGQEYITNIEKELKPEERKLLNIGPIQLKVIRQGETYIWLDSENKEIDRELVGRIFVWAHLALPEIRLKERSLQCISVSEKDTNFLKEVQQLITEHAFESVSEIAFEYQEEEMQFMTMRGLQKQESGSFDIIAFGFYNGNIIKIPCTFNDNLEKLIPQSKNVVSFKEFFEFCEEKYSESILHLESEYSNYFINHDAKKKNEYLKAIIEETVKNQTPYFKGEDINKLKELARIAVETHNKDKLSLLKSI